MVFVADRRGPQEIKNRCLRELGITLEGLASSSSRRRGGSCRHLLVSPSSQTIIAKGLARMTCTGLCLDSEESADFWSNESLTDTT